MRRYIKTDKHKVCLFDPISSSLPEDTFSDQNGLKSWKRFNTFVLE